MATIELNKLSITDAFRAVQDWAAQAGGLDSAQYPDHSSLRFLLLKQRRSIVGVDAEMSSYDGQPVVGFQIQGEGAIGIKTRYVLPVHFAIMRSLELVPGISMRLNDDAHKAHHRRQGNERSDEELIYALGIHSSALLARESGLPKRSRLDRILFNAAPDAALYPRRTGDHHYVVPSGSVPLRTRLRYAQTQETWLEAVENSIRKAELPDLQALPNVLRMLFATADRWHRDELIDRLPDDPWSTIGSG
ncbi:hypothetical protein ACFIOY_29880 [Bradyrhizobium sp. TZ2]